LDTSLLSSTPSLTSRASASKSLTIMVGGTIGRDIVTRVSQRAPSGSSLKSHASTAIVVSQTAAGNGDARLGSLTPRLTSRADALKGLTIVVSGSRAISREVVASVGKRAPSGSTVESETSSTVIMSGAASRNSNTSFSSGAPTESSRADALKSLTIVVSGSGAISRNVVASVGKRAPSGSSFESQTVSAVIIGSAAGRDNNAQLTSDAPGLSGGTSAFASRAVMVGWVRTVKRESVTLVCN